MANLTVASVCNLNCPYCFAAMHMQTVKEGRTAAFVSLEAFEKRLDFLRRSGIREVRLIGGEPTLHPRFAELVRLAQALARPLVVFSHGLMSEKALACLEALPKDACVILINMNATREAGGPTAKERTRRRDVIRRLGPRALLGFTIYETTFNLDFLIPLIEEAGCHRAIRLGLAQPIVSGQNVYLHPKHYPAVGYKIAQFARNAEAHGITMEFDCGFVRCMFCDEDLEMLRRAKANVGWRCNPILDIGIDGQAIHCFPLTGRVQVSMNDATDAAGLRQQLAGQTNHYRAAGIYRECSTCPYKNQDQCSGGCLAQTLRRFQRAPFRLEIPVQQTERLSGPVSNPQSPFPVIKEEL